MYYIYVIDEKTDAWAIANFVIINMNVGSNYQESFEYLVECKTYINTKLVDYFS